MSERPHRRVESGEMWRGRVNRPRDRLMPYKQNWTQSSDHNKGPPAGQSLPNTRLLSREKDGKQTLIEDSKVMCQEQASIM